MCFEFMEFSPVLEIKNAGTRRNRARPTETVQLCFYPQSEVCKDGGGREGTCIKRNHCSRMNKWGAVGMPMCPPQDLLSIIYEKPEVLGIILSILQELCPLS